MKPGIEKSNSTTLSKERRCFQTLNRVITFPLIILVRLYRKVISPALPPSCRFTPTCSEYSLEVLKKYGFFKGLFLSVKRILKCHPFHPGGYDPVP